jgi:hypothetical protein
MAQDSTFLFRPSSSADTLYINDTLDMAIEDTAKVSGIVYEEDERTQGLLKALAKFNVEGNFVIKDGYQIQISFSSDRATAEEQRTKFIRMYPSIESRIEYDAPNYTVKVGSFENIDDAEDFRTLITSSFPTCIIQRTRIKIPISRN